MSANMTLMRAMGAPGFDPMPTAQHAWFLNSGESGVNRFVAWVWQHTIVVDHPSKEGGRRSPRAVDSKGKPQKIEDAAEYFGWDMGYARRQLRKAIAQGRVSTDRYRRILLCGTVSPTGDDPEDELEQAPAVGEENVNEKDCTRYVPAYILLKIRERTKSERAKILAEEKAAADRYERRLADAQAQLRAERDREQDERFRRYGLPERRKLPESKRPAKRAMTVQLTFVDLDADGTNVEIGTANYVQSSGEIPDERTVHSRKTDSVQSMFLNTGEIRGERTTTTETAADPEPEANVVVVNEIVLDELRKHGTVTPKAAAQFESNCRASSPDATPENIVTVIQKVSSRFSRSTKNPVGVLFTQVPALFAGYRRPAPQPTPVDTGEEDMALARNILAHPEDAGIGLVKWARETLGLTE